MNDQSVETASERQPGLLAGLSDELARAVERGGRAVVTVDARGSGPGRLPASGILWDDNGTVVTAAHVIERPRDITVLLGEGQRQSARLVRRAESADLAVLKIAPAPGAELAPVGSLKVGHLVLALGRPDPSSPMASFGVVSALGNAWRGGQVDPTRYIRTDVGLLPGFSGGALVDTEGRVVGMVSSHLGQGGAVAIATASLHGLIVGLLSGQTPKRGYLGVSAQVVELQGAVRARLGLAQESGLMLMGLEPDGPAVRAGLLVGDIVLALGERVLSDGEALQMALGPEVVGQPLTARVVRGGELVERSIVPVERPA
jgi:S1-C subfamily serine protease